MEYIGYAERVIRRLGTDGPLFTFHLIMKSVLGINLINLYNAIVFQEHKIFTACDISTQLPQSTQLPHPVGVVIGHDVEIGENVRIQQNVTLGRPEPETEAGYPDIADNVRIGAGAVVLGNIKLEEGCVVGANSVVVEDVSAGSTVVGAPASET